MRLIALRQLVAFRSAASIITRARCAFVGHKGVWVLDISTDGASLYRMRDKIRDIRAGVTGAKLRFAAVGDSWSDLGAIPTAFLNMFNASFGAGSAAGTFAKAAAPTGVTWNGAVHSSTGVWELNDASTNPDFLYGTGLDGHTYQTSAAGATFKISNLEARSLAIHTRASGATWRYRVDGGSWVSVTEGSGLTLNIQNITGLSASRHVLDIEKTSSGGVLAIVGVVNSATAPIEVQKVGNGGLTGNRMNRYIANSGPAWASLNPDVVVCILGTNDYRVSYSPPSEYLLALQQLTNALRSQLPDVGIIFVVPPQTNGTAVVPLSQYRDVLYQHCLDTGTEMLNLLDLWGPFNSAYFADNLHLNSLGASRLANDLNTELLGLDMPQVIHWTLAEPWSDPSTGVVITWCSDSATDTVLKYRKRGATAWLSKASQRSRAMTVNTANKLHSVSLTGLEPATVYELMWDGASQTDKFRTCPAEGVRMYAASDLQTTTMGPASAFGKFGAQFQAEMPDLFVIPGDLVSDDGVVNATTDTNWYNFMVAMNTYYRRQGCLVPTVAIFGNHEVANYYTYPNPADRAVGQISTIFSAGFWATHPTRQQDSVGWYQIGNELLVITLDTDHRSRITPQIPWLQSLLAEKADDVRHIVIVGHAPAWPSTAAFAWETIDTQSRALRFEMYPALRPYADKIRFYLTGHIHSVHMVDRRTVEYNASLTPEQNDLRWRQDLRNGIREIGAGPWGGALGNLSPAKVDMVSSLDGSRRISHTLALNADVADQIFTRGNVANIRESFRNVWVADFSAMGAFWRCKGTDGKNFLDGAEYLPGVASTGVLTRVANSMLEAGAQAELLAAYYGLPDEIELETNVPIPIGGAVRFRAQYRNAGATTINGHRCVTVTGSPLPAGYIRTDADTVAVFKGSHFEVSRETEIGYNQEGTFVRYADGRAEASGCEYWASPAEAINIEAGALFRSPLITKAFPISFVQPDVALGDPLSITVAGRRTSAGHGMYATVTAQTVNDFTFMFSSSVEWSLESVGNRYLNWDAVGRWY